MNNKVVVVSWFLLSLVTAQAQAPAPPTAAEGHPAAEVRPGVGVDSRGNPSFDPSENVKALNEAAAKRQDDLRLYSERLTQAQLDALEKVGTIRIQQEMRLLAEQDKRIENEARIRAEYNDKLISAEAKRIDAVRTVDTTAAAATSQRTTEQATLLGKQTADIAEVLRNQVARNADDLRTLVATTAATQLQTQIAAANVVATQMSTLSTRITTLEQSGAEGKGKQTIQDPAFAALLQEVRNLTQARADQAGVGAGRSDVVGWIVGVGGFLIALAMMFMMYNSSSSNKPQRRS